MDKLAHFNKGEVFSFEENLDKNVPLRFRYWRGWMIYHIRLNKGVVFPSIERKYLKEKQQVISDSDPEKLIALLNKAPWVIKDSKIAEKIYQHQHKTNLKLPKIGSKQGITNPDRLVDVIKKDIESFKELTYKRIQRQTVQDMTEDSNDKLVWQKYIKPYRFMLKIYGSDEYSGEGREEIFRCFDIMKNHANHEYPYVAAFEPNEEPILLLVKSDATLKDGFSVYQP